MGQEQSNSAKSYGPRPCDLPPRRRRPAPVPVRAPRARVERRVERPIRLADITNEPEYLQPKIRPYVVHEAQRFVEDITAPFEQTIYQPVIQPVVRQAQPVLDTFVKRRVQPVVTQRIVPRYSTVVRDGPAAPLQRTPAVIENERLQPVVRRVQSPVRRGPVEDDCDSDTDEYMSEGEQEYVSDDESML